MQVKVTLTVDVDESDWIAAYGVKPEEVRADVISWTPMFVESWLNHHMREVNNGTSVVGDVVVESEDIAADGSLRVSPEVAGALSTIADTLTAARDPLNVMDAREEAVALLALLAGGSWGAGTRQ
jgi:hypothetical protein